MEMDKTIKDIMVPIERYDTIDVEEPLCNALMMMKMRYDQLNPELENRIIKSVFVTEKSRGIIGKLDMYHLIRAFVPTKSRDPESRAIQALISSRVRDAAAEVDRIQERFNWVNTSFSELVQQETRKSIRECMVPAHPVLKEDDTINWAIYNMFRLNVRQLLVTRGKEVVGVLNFRGIFDELMRIVGPSCELIMPQP
ncbi:MAG: CBS domain-containing protein [Thermodesulfobacteriota bacterium]